jgi:integrase
MKPTPPQDPQEDQPRPKDQERSLETLKQVVGNLDLTPEDLLMVLSSVVSLKQKKREEDQTEKGNKIFQDKIYLWENTKDSFIYRDGRTKNGNFYLRIYCRETKKVFSKSLRTNSREEGIVLGRKMYSETYGKLIRGEKTKSLTTKDLIRIYLEREERRISPLPKTGITLDTWKTKKQYLSVWDKYINNELGMGETKIENIPPDLTRDFQYWVQRQDKSYYKDTQYSPDYINSIISEVNRMYRQVGVRDKFISSSLVPQIDLMKKPPSTQVKRDILTVDEYERLVRYLRTNEYLKPEGSSQLEQTKRSIFREFIGISYNTGMRPKEILGLTWGDVSVNISDTKENQKIFRLLKVRSENSKTGKMRSVNGPVGRRLERLKKTYEDIGMECSPDQYIFRNPTWKRQDKNIPYHQKVFTDRLEKVLKETGLQEELEKTNRRITLYSSRHFYTTLRLQNGLDIHLLSKQLGTSTTYIDQTYSHIQVETNTERITQGMSLIKTLENE